MEQNQKGFSHSDRPIEEISQDLLRRDRYIHHLAKFIRDFDESESYVIGLYGPWGSGKTSIINLLKNELENGDEENSFVIIDYQPWSYLKDEELTIDFIKTVRKGLRKFPKTRKMVGIIGNILSNIAGCASYVLLGRDLAKYAKAIIREETKSQSVRKMKDRISKKLRDVPNKVIVFVDNLDRLDAEEIRSLIRTIKNVLDFPNTVFFLAFDYEIVSQALTDLQDGGGDDYLSKIVQFVTDVPVIDEETLFNQVIAECFLKDELQKFDDRRLYDIELYFIQGRVSTLREAKRLVNAYLFRHTSMGDDTDPLDLFALTTLEVLDHQFYLWIAENRRSLVEAWFTTDYEKPVSEMRELLRRDLEDENHFETRWRQLGYLFPRYRADQGQVAMPMHPCALRDRNYVDCYFSDVLPSTSISAVELEALLEIAKTEPPRSLALRIVSEDKEYTAAIRLEPMLRKCSLEQRRSLVYAMLPTMRFEATARDEMFFKPFLRWRRLMEWLLNGLGSKDALEVFRLFFTVATTEELLGLAWTMRDERLSHIDCEKNGAPFLEDEDWELLKVDYYRLGVQAMSDPNSYSDNNADLFLMLLKDYDEQSFDFILREAFELPLGVCYFSDLITSEAQSSEGPIDSVRIGWLPDELSKEQLVDLIGEAVKSKEFWKLQESKQVATASVYLSVMDIEHCESFGSGVLGVYRRKSYNCLENWRLAS